jgi:hypothetical protein
MRPFRTAIGPKDQLGALAERLIIGMSSAKVDLPESATPSALWTLAIAVAGWWLKGRSPEIDEAMQTYRSLAVLFELFGSVRTLPAFAATAALASSYPDLAEAGNRFGEVVSEVGPAKLRAALASGVFERLQAQLLADYPVPADVAQTLRPPAQVPSQVVGASGSPVRPASALPVVSGRIVPPPKAQADTTPESAPAQKPSVSPQTVAFLRERYPDAKVARILKG